MKDNRLKKYEQIFIPSSPVRERKYLFGREQEIKDLRAMLRRPGEHPIVIGDRGVGKTSLVKQVLRDYKVHSVWRTCDPSSTFEMVFKDLLKQCGLDFGAKEETKETTSEGQLKVTPFNLGLAGKMTKMIGEKYTPSSFEATPWNIFKALESFNTKIILVLDEYDAVHFAPDSKKFNQNTAYTIKVLSDNNEKCDSRIIVVGVAASSEELLDKHESIQRNVHEIYLRPLKREHILDFLSAAEVDLEYEFDYKVKQRIADASLGYPYFVHVVGLKSIEAMLQRDERAKKITWADLVTGVHDAVEYAFRNELSKYRPIHEFASQDEKYIIEDLALLKNPHPKREELRRAVCDNHRILEGDFEKALNSLTQEKRFLYMSRRRDEIRFIDPLMKPFLKEKLLFGGVKIDPSQKDLFDGTEDE